MRCAIFFSGTGNTMNALLAAEKTSAYNIDLLVTDNAQAAGIALAEQYDKDLLIIPAAGSNRQQWQQRVQSYLKHVPLELIVLAGFMRLLSADFVTTYANKIINIHPSLLPDFKGLNTHARALEAGVSDHGFTIHLVTEALDSGAILAQGSVPILDQDTASSLQERVQQRERQCYPQVLDWIAKGTLRWDSDILYMNNNPLNTRGVAL